MMDYDMGWAMGWSWREMLLLWVMPLLVVIVLAMVAVKYLYSRAARSDIAPAEDKHRALEILEERYARGEVDREEYLERRGDLTRANMPRRRSKTSMRRE